MTRAFDRKWLVWLLGGVVAVQIYYVKELLAVLLLAAIVFVVFGVLIGVLLLVHKLGTRAMEWLEIGVPVAVPERRRIFMKK